MMKMQDKTKKIKWKTKEQREKEKKNQNHTEPSVFTDAGRIGCSWIESLETIQ